MFGFVQAVQLLWFLKKRSNKKKKKHPLNYRFSKMSEFLRCYKRYGRPIIQNTKTNHAAFYTQFIYIFIQL